MRRWGVGMKACTAALLMAACGGGSSPSGTQEAKQATTVLASTYSRTVAARTAKISMVMAVQSNGHSYELSADGVDDFADRTGQLTLTLPTGTAELRLIRGTAYEQLPGQPWRQVPVPAIGASAAPTDPNLLLSYLQSASGNVARIGTADIRGVPTTAYLANVDLTKLARNAAQSATAQVALSQLGTSIIPVRLWVDAQGLPRQMQFDMVSQPGSLLERQNFRLRMTMDLYDFGTIVDVTAPM